MAVNPRLPKNVGPASKVPSPSKSHSAHMVLSWVLRLACTENVTGSATTGWVFEAEKEVMLGCGPHPASAATPAAATAMRIPLPDTDTTLPG